MVDCGNLFETWSRYTGRKFSHSYPPRLIRSFNVPVLLRVHRAPSFYACSLSF